MEASLVLQRIQDGDEEEQGRVNDFDKYGFLLLACPELWCRLLVPLTLPVPPLLPTDRRLCQGRTE